MGKDDLIEAARLGNYPTCEKILCSKPKRPGPFASLRRGSGGCNSRDSSGYTALHYAALNGHLDIVELLLSYEASCNSADDKGSSPLHLAAWAGNKDIVDMLLTKGPSIANVNLTNADKETALHSASQYGHLETVQILLEHHADPNIKNSRDETPLDLAALYGRTETVRVLLKTHPELVGPYTAYGGAMYTHTPLHLASRNGHREVVELILGRGFDINVRTARGTALHEAAVCGKKDVVKYLLESNVNLELRDRDDKTVLEVMDDLNTPMTREVIHLVLDHMGVRRRATVSSSASGASNLPPGAVGGHPAVSPYDNLSMTQSLDESYSIDLEFSTASGATSTNTSRASSRCMDETASPPVQLRRYPPHAPQHSRHTLQHEERGRGRGRGEEMSRRPRSAKSVEDMLVDPRRISSLSSTSGCSDCTTATLQGSHSVASSYGFSETDETITAETMTPNQLTLQAISTDEEDCIVDELAKDPISVPRLSREVRDSEYHTQENASISSDNESCNSIPLEKPDSRTEIDKVELRKVKKRVTRLSNTSGASINIDSSNTQGKPPISNKPTLPAKPLHIRPGLKAVKIPTVDDKILSQLPPKKPPRRNVSMSPVKIGDLSSDAVKSQPRSIDSRKFIQDSRITKSVDELDDILSTEKELDESSVILSTKRKTKEDNSASGKKSRRTMSFGGARMKPDSLQLSVIGYNEKEAQDEPAISSIRNKAEHFSQPAFDKVDTVDQARYSCDDVLMTRSLHDPKMVMGNQSLGNEEGDLLSDSASSQMSVSNYHLSGGCSKDHASDTTSDTASATSGNSGMVCQRCLLNTMSNRTMLASTECGADNHRFISQRQYKRKLRKDCPSYATMERKGSKSRKNGGKEHKKDEDEELNQEMPGNGTLRKMKMISKTTFKLRSTIDLDDLEGSDSAGTCSGMFGNNSNMNNNSEDLSLELMEIPLSPTNYNQPPTPPGLEPPPPIFAEMAITRVLDRLKNESKRTKRSRGTETEACYMLPLGLTKWPEKKIVATEDKVTTMDIEVSFGNKHNANRSDESLGSPSSSITGISNGSAGATEKSSLRMDNVNNNNNQNNMLVVGGNNTNVNSGSGGLFTLHNNSQHINNNNSLGIYSGASSLSGDNMSIGSITDIPVGNRLPYTPTSEERSLNDISSSCTNGTTKISGSSQPQQSSGKSVWSPFDEKEEWNKISQIIDSFGSDIGANVKTSITPNNSPNEEEYPTWKKREKVLLTVEDWLSYIGLGKYANTFISNGYDDLNFLGEDVISCKQDLVEIGISDEKDIAHLLESLKKKGNSAVCEVNKTYLATKGVDEWLESLNLKDAYLETFTKNLFTSMEKVSKIWDDELTSILDIDKIGHRKRILLSVAGKHDIANRFGKVENTVPAEEKEKVSNMEIDNQEQESPATFRRKKVNATEAISTSKEITKTLEEKNSSPKPKHDIKDKLDIRRDSKEKLKQASSKQISNTGTTEVANGSGTLNKSRKKKAAPPPPVQQTPSQASKKESNDNNDVSSSSSISKSSGKRPSKKEKKQSLSSFTVTSSNKEDCPFLAFKVKYYAKKSSKDFKGTDTTKAAIESSKKSKGGKKRYLVLSEKDVKILKRDAKEVAATHEISNVCCVVRDNNNPAIFGYATTTTENTAQNLAHVFTTDSPEKAAEILSVICEGFTPSKGKARKLAHEDALVPMETDSPSPPSGTTAGQSNVPSSSSSQLTAPPTTPSSGIGSSASSSRFRSDQIVSRMKLFFQGGSNSKSDLLSNLSSASNVPSTTDRSGIGGRRSQSPSKTEARRKRGGSVDNLLDDLDEGEILVKRKHGHAKLSGESKKKSLSTKNLTGVGSAKKTSDAV